MTDVNDNEIAEIEQGPGKSSRRAMLGLAGVGIAGAVALRGSGAEALDGDNVVVGGTFEGDTPTSFDNTSSGATTPGTPGGEAIVGTISGADNGSHAIRGFTAGKGHAIAGVIGSPTDPSTNVVGATWGRHYGQGAAVEGDSRTETAAIAGPANAVKGTIVSPNNGSHAINGFTNGQGHAVAGESFNTTADAKAATWGRHVGPAAATEGVSINATEPIAGKANGVKGIVANAGNGSHAVLGVTAGGGHAVAGDIEASAPNTVAATWGRHKGTGAGIGGISVGGYGGEFQGGPAQIRLIQEATAPVGAPTTGDHKLGELFVDGAGNLYLNKADGLNFTRLNDQPGSLRMLATPERAYDSRPGKGSSSSQKGKLTDNEVRVIDLTAETSFPAGAAGALLNITVTETEVAGGYLTVFSNDLTTTPKTSTVNWFGSNQNIANGATISTDAAGKIKIFCRKSTHVVVDVTGYVN